MNRIESAYNSAVEAIASTQRPLGYPIVIPSSENIVRNPRTTAGRRNKSTPAKPHRQVKTG